MTNKSVEEAFQQLENATLSASLIRQRVIDAQLRLDQEVEALANAEQCINSLTDIVLAIGDEDHYRRMIDHVTTIMMEPDPDPDTPEGRRLDARVSAIVTYEERFYPVGEPTPENTQEAT